jgi:hypothetical protein
MEGELMGLPLTEGLPFQSQQRLGRQWLLYLPVAIAKRFRFVHTQPKTGELDTEGGPVA